MSSARGFDRQVMAVGLLAAMVSFTALLYFLQRDLILIYGDAEGHINIARRIFDSRTPGLLQIGTVWLPLPHLLTPFVSGVEFFGGLFLLAGLLTRISAGALGITMIVAIASAKWGDVDSLETLLGFDETEYLALFLWLAIAGAGRLSLDFLLERRAVR